MKKLLAILLAALMLLSLAACGSSSSSGTSGGDSDSGAERTASKMGDTASGEEETAPAEAAGDSGYYQLYNAVEDGEDFGHDLLAAAGMTETCYLLLYPDGTAYLYIWGDSVDLEWEEGYLTADGDSLEYTFDDDGMLVIDFDGEVLYMELVSTEIPDISELPTMDEEYYEDEVIDEDEENPSEDASEAAVVSGSASGDFVPFDLVSTDEFVVTVTDIYYDDWGDYTWDLYIENNTDTDVTVELDYFALDGCMTDTYLYEEVKAGKKANTNFYTYDELEEYGITGDPTVADMKLVIEDSDYNDVYMDVLSVALCGEDAVVYAEYDYGNDIILVDNDDLVVTITGAADDDSWEETNIYFFVWNKTDSFIILDGDDVYVNDYAVDGWLYTQVAPGCFAFDYMCIDYEDMNDGRAADIATMDITLNAYDYDTWDDILPDTDFSVELG